MHVCSTLFSSSSFLLLLLLLFSLAGVVLLRGFILIGLSMVLGAVLNRYLSDITYNPNVSNPNNSFDGVTTEFSLRLIIAILDPNVVAYIGERHLNFFFFLCCCFSSLFFSFFLMLFLFSSPFLPNQLLFLLFLLFFDTPFLYYFSFIYFFFQVGNLVLTSSSFFNF